MSHTIEFQPSGRGKAQCPADPAYPHGIALDCTRAQFRQSHDSLDIASTCTLELPYPAPECGLWMVSCDDCPLTVAITAAGRVDDPISVKMACRKKHD